MLGRLLPALTVALVVLLLYLDSVDALSRQKRYVAFPEGSSIACTICLTIGMIGNPNKDYISWAENWGVAYDLPNYKWAREHANGFRNETKHEVQRRSRHDLYEKIELAMERMGFNGRACVERALCESGRYLYRLQQGRGNMIEEIVKTIFSFPQEEPLPYESTRIQHYDRVYRRSRRATGSDCSVEKSKCHISLLDLAFGKYSTAARPTISITEKPVKAFM